MKATEVPRHKRSKLIRSSRRPPKNPSTLTTNEKRIGGFLPPQFKNISQLSSVMFPRFEVEKKYSIYSTPPPNKYFQKTWKPSANLRKCWVTCVFFVGDLFLKIFPLRELSNANLAIEKFSKLAQNHSKFSSLYIILHPLKQKRTACFGGKRKSLTTTPRKPGWQSVLQPVSGEFLAASWIGNTMKCQAQKDLKGETCFWGRSWLSRKC